MRDNRENSAKDRSVEFGVNPKNNNALVAISLAFTVGSCCVFYILLFAHAYTNWPKGLKSTQSIWQKSSSEISRKIKRNTPIEQFWSPTDFSLFHNWIMFIFGYVVRLDVSFIMDGGDHKTLSGKVLFMLNSSSSMFKLAWFYSDLGRFNRWSILILRYIMHDSKLYILTVGFEKQI